jgi:predicted Zn-dependent protease
LWEAIEELDSITVDFWLDPEVLLARYEIYAKAGKWGGAADLMALMVAMQPENPRIWHALAEAVLRNPTESVGQAKRVLLTGHQLFPRDPLLAYKLACCESRSGNLDEAQAWLGKAFQTGDTKVLKMMALLEPDLQPLSEYN